MKIFSPKIIFSALLAFLAIQFFDPTFVFAEGTDVGDNEVLKGVAQLLSIFVNIFTFLALLFLNYGGDLLGTEFLTAETPMEAIRPMWVIVRNITNIGFVLVLLFLAFSNLFNFGDGGNWTIKEKLPKVIFALIAINFSLLGFRVLIDAVHVGTITILAIPQTALESKGADSIERLLSQGVNEEGKHCSNPENKVDENTTCQHFYTRVNYLLCKDSFHSSGDPRNDWEASSSSDCLFRIKNLDNLTMQNAKSMTAHNLFLAFGVFFQKLEQLPALAAELNSWTGVITNVLFSGILALAYVVALIAVFIALLLRMVVLWIAMVFSPLIVAAGIMGFGGQGGDVGGRIINNLIIPLKVAAAFAVSFIMISAMIDVIPQNSGNFFEFGASINQFGTNGYGLLWQIATVVVFWAAAFWALENAEGKEIIQMIKGGAQKAGTFMARAATIDRQVFPFIGKDGKASKTSMGAILKAPMAVVDEGIRQRDVAQRKELEELLGIDNATRKFRESLDELSDELGKTSDKVSHFKKVRGFLGEHNYEVIKENKANVAKELSENVDNIDNLSDEKKEEYKDAVKIFKEKGNIKELATVMASAWDGVTAEELQKEFEGKGTESGTESKKEGGNKEGETTGISYGGGQEIKIDMGKMQRIASGTGIDENTTVNTLRSVLEAGGIQASELAGLNSKQLGVLEGKIRDKVGSFKFEDEGLQASVDRNLKDALQRIANSNKEVSVNVLKTERGRKVDYKSAEIEIEGALYTSDAQEGLVAALKNSDKSKITDENWLEIYKALESWGTEIDGKDVGIGKAIKGPLPLKNALETESEEI